MKKAGKITIAAAVMVVCLLVTVITAKCSLKYDDEIASFSSDKKSLDDQLAKLDAQNTELDTSIQNLKEEWTGEEATNGEGEQETSKAENHVLSENGEEPVTESQGIAVQNESGESEPGTTVENEEQSETDSVDSTPAKDYEYAQNQYQIIIQDVQKALNSEGFSCTVDGYWGDETSTAITEYQKANRLPVTGDITDELLGSLGV